MNALTRATQRTIRPTPDEPIPNLDGEHGLKLLRSMTASRLAETLDPSEVETIKRTCRTILDSLTPATAAEVATIMEALALHFPVLRRTDGENRVVQRQWFEDLEGWPADLVAEGARLWRNSGKERFPTAGQFKADIQPMWDHRQRLGRRASEFLDIAKGKS